MPICNQKENSIRASAIIGLDDKIKNQTTFAGSSSSGTVTKDTTEITIIAAGTYKAGTAVYIDSNGKAAKAVTNPAIGILKADSTINVACTVVLNGVMALTDANLTNNKYIGLVYNHTDASTHNLTTGAAVFTSGYIIQRLGYRQDSSNIIVKIEDFYRVL